MKYVDNLTNAANAIDNAIESIDGFLRANLADLHGTPQKNQLHSRVKALRKLADATYADVERWLEEEEDTRTIVFRVPGLAFDDYLNPRLGTEMSERLKEFYDGSRRHGQFGRVHFFVNVPVSTVKDLIEDMANVAELRVANGGEDLPIGKAMERTLVKLREKVAV